MDPKIFQRAVVFLVVWSWATGLDASSTYWPFPTTSLGGMFMLMPPYFVLPLVGLENAIGFFSGILYGIIFAMIFLKWARPQMQGVNEVIDVNSIYLQIILIIVSAAIYLYQYSIKDEMYRYQADIFNYSVVFWIISVIGLVFLFIKLIRKPTVAKIVWAKLAFLMWAAWLGFPYFGEWFI